MPSEALAGAVFDAALGNSAVTTLVMPWEQGVFSQIFGDATTGPVPLADRPSDVRITMQETAELPSQEEAAKSSIVRFRSSSTEIIFLKHAVPLLARKARLCDEDLFELHVQRFELVLAHSYEASVLGRSFRGASLSERHSKVRLALGDKAPCTLQRRYGQSAKLVSWADAERVKAFPIDGQIAEEFLRHLVESGSRHSVLTGAVECFTFLHHVLGVDMEPRACSNPIVQGILRKARLERPEKKQARTLLVAEVLDLEAMLADGARPLIDRYCAGAFLFALYGRARLGDLKVLKPLTVSSPTFLRMGRVVAVTLRFCLCRTNVVAPATAEACACT